MDRLIDKALIVLCCFAALLLSPLTVAFVACFLVAVIVTALSEIASAPPWLRLGCTFAYLCAALFIPVAVAFIPLVIYDCVKSESWAVRLGWIPMVALALRALKPEALIILVLACAISAVLARKTARLDSELVTHNEQSDELRGYSLTLANKNRRLKEEQVFEVQRARQSERESLARKIHDDVGKRARSDGLTQREFEVVERIAQGYDNKEIAAELFMSEGTVRNHVSTILQKLSLKNRTQLARYYYQAW